MGKKKKKCTFHYHHTDDKMDLDEPDPAFGDWSDDLDNWFASKLAQVAAEKKLVKSEGKERQSVISEMTAVDMPQENAFEEPVDLDAAFKIAKPKHAKIDIFMQFTEVKVHC